MWIHTGSFAPAWRILKLGVSGEVCDSRPREEGSEKRMESSSFGLTRRHEFSTFKGNWVPLFDGTMLMSIACLNKEALAVWSSRLSCKSSGGYCFVCLRKLCHKKIAVGPMKELWKNVLGEKNWCLASATPREWMVRLQWLFMLVSQTRPPPESWYNAGGKGPSSIWEERRSKWKEGRKSPRTRKSKSLFSCRGFSACIIYKLMWGETELGIKLSSGFDLTRLCKSRNSLLPKCDFVFSV